MSRSVAMDYETLRERQARGVTQSFGPLPAEPNVVAWIGHNGGALPVYGSAPELELADDYERNDHQ